jgi:hypothetical protein
MIISNPLYGASVDQSWKSPYNQIEEGKLVDNIRNRRGFTIKGSPTEFTQIFALVGPGSAFTEYAERAGLDSNTAEPDAILLIDCKNELIHWMEPGDIAIGPLLHRDNDIGDVLASNYRQGFLIAFVDGAVWWIRTDVPQKVIAPFFTLEGARAYDRDDALAKYALRKLPPLDKEDGKYVYRPTGTDSP